MSMTSTLTPGPDSDSRRDTASHRAPGHARRAAPFRPSGFHVPTVGVAVHDALRTALDLHKTAWDAIANPNGNAARLRGRETCMHRPTAPPDGSCMRLCLGSRHRAPLRSRTQGVRRHTVTLSLAL